MEDQQQQLPPLSDSNSSGVITSSSGNFSDEEDNEVLWYRYNVYVSGALVAAYGLVFVAGLVGNLLVAFAVLRGSRTMRRCVTNIFLVNLAAADLLVVLACIPFTLVAHLIYRKSSDVFVFKK